ncbi:MAG TPA: O-antigen ligase family protein [Thermoanaerobaculia bacterium]|nr:O-antigen ligase family protein [Thermoanaerobaculia bacterium]
MGEVLFPAGPTRSERLALRVVQLGAIAVVLVASTYRLFDLDRFFVPKELVLHATAAIAALLVVRALRIADGIDWLLAGFLLLSAIGALTATNPWLAMRALAVSASGIALFWVARALRDAGLARPLVNAIAVAVVLASITSLLQAYGVRLDIFSINRAPGGTLGNRNFVAHAAAFGLPVVLLAALRARNAGGYLIGALGTSLVTASLVLTRSRAAWLAFAAMALVFAFGVVRTNTKMRLRFLGVLALVGGGVAAALLLPNALRWRSDNPYLESVRGVVNYEEGSGRGRLIQYERSLRMAATRPLFGVGPGNWSVEYPEHARDNDPSLDPSSPGMTFNPWPSSDWVAFVAERGLAAALLMAAAFIALAVSGFRRIGRALDAEERLTAATSTSIVVAAAIAGAFDAVLLLAVPTLLVWTSLGALAAVDETQLEARPRSQTFVAVLVLLVTLAGAARSSAQLLAMHILATDSDRTSLQRAAQIDPGNFRLRLRMARSGKRQQRCEHAEAAKRLYPHASAAKALRGCD